MYVRERNRFFADALAPWSSFDEIEPMLVAALLRSLAQQKAPGPESIQADQIGVIVSPDFARLVVRRAGTLLR